MGRVKAFEPSGVQKDLPIPSPTAGPGQKLSYRIGLSPRNRVPIFLWPLLILLIIPIAMMLVLVSVLGLVAAIFPGPRRKMRANFRSWRHPLEVEVDRHPAAPGEDVSIMILQRRPTEVEELRVELVCDENASYTMGTRTETDTHRVHHETIETWLPDTTSGTPPDQIDCVIRIPDAAMHSFAASNNQIVWSVVVTRRFPRMSEVESKFEFQVLPVPVMEQLLLEREGAAS